MSNKHTITAIDIGSHKITCIIAVRDSVGGVRVLGVNSSVSKGVKRGLITDIEQVTQAVDTALQKAERMSGTQAREVYVSVGGQHISSQNSHGVVAVNSSKGVITEEDVSRAIDAAKAISIPASRHVLHVSPKQFIVDGQDGIHNPIGMNGVRLEVDCHIITASATNLRNIERVLEEADVQNSGFVFCAMASGEIVSTDAEKDLGVAVVDIGAGKTDVAVYLEGALSHSFCIPIGARHITQDLAVGLRLPLEIAEDLKIFMSQNYRQAPSRSKTFELPDISQYLSLGEAADFTAKTVYEGIIVVRIEEIATMLHEYLEKEGLIRVIPAGLVLCGGGSHTIGIVDIFKDVIRTPVRKGKFTIALSGLNDDVMDPTYATSVGLLLAGQKLQIEKKQEGSFWGGFSFPFSNSFGLSGNAGGFIQKVRNALKQFLP
jgi:cell division protein FtsA